MDSAIRRVPSGFPGWVAYFHVYGGFGEYIIAKEVRPGGHQARPTALLRPAQMPYRFPRAGASSSCSKTWAQPWAQNPPEYRAIPWSIMQGSGRRTNYIAFLEQSVGPRFKSWRAHQFPAPSRIRILQIGIPLAAARDTVLEHIGLTQYEHSK